MKPSATPQAILERVGLKRTAVRLGVLKLLLAERQALSVQQIHRRLPPDTDPVTVYRTVTTLAKKGVLHPVRGDDRAARYAVGEREPGASHRHPHFLCDECGRSECLDGVELPAAAAADRHPRMKKGYEIRYSEVILHGCCPKCRA
jgi:Fur family ferric uptake transcriptional regulator